MNTSEFFTKLNVTDFTTNPVMVWDDVEFDSDEFTDLIKANSTWKMLVSSDGFVSHVFEDPQADSMDHSHTTQFFGLHTDGQYLPEVPPLCLLYCADAGTSSTPTVFADSRRLVETLQEKGLFKDAQEIDFIYTKKEGKEFRRPLIETHPLTDEYVMCVATKSPPIRVVPAKDSTKTQDEADKFFDVLSDLAESTLDLSAHYWKTKQMVVFDNASLIHGRGLPEHQAKATVDADRHLVRIWIGKIS